MPEPDTRGLVVEGLSLQTGEPPRFVLDHLHFRINPGDPLAVVDPVGAAGLALVDILAAIRPATAGRVTLGGVKIIEDSRSGGNLYRNKAIALFDREPDLLPTCTVLENILLPTLVTVHDTTGKARGLAALQEAGLEGKGDCPVTDLSPIEMLDVTLARARVNRPPLWIAHDPAFSLVRKDRLKWLTRMRDTAAMTGTVLLFLTSDATLAKSLFARTAHVGADGVLIQDGGTA